MTVPHTWLPAVTQQTVTGFDALDVPSLGKVFAGATFAVVVTPLDPTRGHDMAAFKEDGEMCCSMIRAAVEAGVKHVIYVGSWTTTAADSLTYLASRFAPAEALLEEVRPCVLLCHCASVCLWSTRA